MAAKLKWVGEQLRFGAFDVARTRNTTPSGRLYVYAVGWGADSEPYESLIDCMQDCEAETRRQLREAGVEVEP
jgi:hypothetical protein